jgi:hypothetical protein
MIKRRRRYRPSVTAPAASRPPVPQGCFDWLPERELVVGVGKRCAMGTMERLELLYGPSKPDEAAE